MTPHDDYERYLDAFGERLHDATAAVPDRRPRRRWLFGLSGGVVLAGAATAAILLAVGGGAAGPRLDAVAQARDALAPKGKIVHLVLSTRVAHVGRPDGPAMRSEQWAARSPQRWRLRQRLNSPYFATYRSGHYVRLRGWQSFAYAGGTQRTYTAQLREVTVQRVDPAKVVAPSLLHAGGGDPADDLRAKLARGELRDAGVAVDRQGRHVRRLVSASGPGEDQIERLEYEVDPVTFVPVRLTWSHGERSSKLRPRVTTLVVDVVRYETVSDSPANAHLLRIQVPPHTRVRTAEAALQEDIKGQLAWRKHCQALKQSGRRCAGPGKP